MRKEFYQEITDEVLLGLFKGQKIMFKTPTYTVTLIPPTNSWMLKMIGEAREQGKYEALRFLMEKREESNSTPREGQK